MKLSRYFANLSSSYDAELDDLRTDSEGKNVLKTRLAQKRSQFKQLMPMIQFAPEMVAAALHGAFLFKKSLALETLITREANKFPSWSTLQPAVLIEPWAQSLVDIVLAEPEGEKFLLTTIGLEYLHRGNQTRAAEVVYKQEEETEREEEGDEQEEMLNSDERLQEDDQQDLDEAGADWLAEQGFDRRES
jgi:hypothetical protein